MAEENIAQYRWRIPTDEFSTLCDNTLILDGTDSLIDGPVNKNSNGFCRPECTMCITALEPPEEEPAEDPENPSV